VIVATDSAEVAKISERHGASAFRDPPDARTLADVADAALSNVSARGAGAALVLVSDLPEATGEDVDRLIDEMEAFDVVLARDSRGVHTNALGLRLETGFRTRFGSAESAREHRESAERAGLSVGDVQSPTLSFDVDTPEDYALLLARS
jgi:2-phospho-L-lactate guanylyltransferase